MKNKKIIILDFSKGEVYIKDYDENIWEDGEHFLDGHGFRETDCQWMITDNLKLNID